MADKRLLVTLGSLLLPVVAFAQAERPGAQMFRQMDKNGDGKVARSEATGPLATFFNRIDTDRDGFVTPEEMKAVRDRSRPSSPPSPPTASSDSAQPQRPDPMQMFQVLDANRDGVITTNEAPERAAPILDRADENRDGRVTRAEMEDMVRRQREYENGMPPSPPTTAGPRPMMADAGPADGTTVLSVLDRDGDGKVSRAEAPERLAQAFDRADTNRDGYLDLAEVQRIAARLQTGGRPMTGPYGGRLQANRPVRQVFNDQDTDADGRLTRAEARGQYASQFDAWDTDKNGQLDLREAEAAQQE